MANPSSPEQTLLLTPPDDFHLHVRDGAILETTVIATASRFRRAIIMPNLKPPVVTTGQALQYRERILSALKASPVADAYALQFEPLMTLYLTDRMQPEEIQRAKESGVVFAVKLYPAGATTNSENGVTDMLKVYPVLREMAKCGLPLLIHGEVTDQSVDIFDREAAFIPQIRALVAEIPTLRVVMEHITTRDAVDFVSSAPPHVAATITAHHLLYNRNALFKGGLCPHMYCLPVLKHEEHRKALLAAVASGSPKFFAGTDSAPHARETKEASCGCAGCYTAFAAVELYAESFDEVGALDKLPAFLCEHGADFYGLPRNNARSRDRLALRRQTQRVPPAFPMRVGDVRSELVPLRAGDLLQWTAVPVPATSGAPADADADAATVASASAAP